jgi:3-hydroxypropanoate dehydrogenase
MAEIRSTATPPHSVSSEAVNQLFREARTPSAWLPRPVPIEKLREAYEIARGAPQAQTLLQRALYFW